MWALRTVASTAAATAPFALTNESMSMSGPRTRKRSFWVTAIAFLAPSDFASWAVRMLEVCDSVAAMNRSALVIPAFSSMPGSDVSPWMSSMSWKIRDMRLPSS